MAGEMEDVRESDSDGLPGQPYGGQDDSDTVLQEAQRETRRANRLVSAGLVLLIVAALGLAWWNRSDDGDSADDAETAAPVEEAEPDTTDGEIGSESGEGSGDGETAATDDESAATGADDGERAVVTVAPALPDPPSAAPYVDATLADNIFVLSGVVPTEEHKAALEARAELAYAPFASSELVVDESVGAAAEKE